MHLNIKKMTSPSLEELFKRMNSTANNPTSFAIPNSTKKSLKKLKKYRRIRDAVKPARVAAAERLLVNYDSLNRDEFKQKLRLSVYFRRQQGNVDLIAKLDEQFGVEAVYVMSDWSAPKIRSQEPIRGLGFRCAAQPVNVEVLKCFGWSITRALIDEEQILV
ncbi:hypothetical protein INT47_002720 [Mucor saturninus]|uniref:Uncharacterized protein n=1 Tax=Mucor saturninus TaxID=64648 RepID=A0A8H7QMR7_9FUNG|nr:hypothetical protein INT47_002720 [Mucor saturninus]